MSHSPPLSHPPKLHPRPCVPPSLVEALAGCDPLPALAEVSEQLFQDGINWGRIVVFFYFIYRVVKQVGLGGGVRVPVSLRGGWSDSCVP